MIVYSNFNNKTLKKILKFFKIFQFNNNLLEKRVFYELIKDNNEFV